VGKGIERLEQKLAAAACQKVTMAEGGQKNDSNCTEVRLS